MRYCMQKGATEVFIWCACEAIHCDFLVVPASDSCHILHLFLSPPCRETNEKTVQLYNIIHRNTCSYNLSPTLISVYNILAKSFF